MNLNLNHAGKPLKFLIPIIPVILGNSLFVPCMAQKKGRPSPHKRETQKKIVETPGKPVYFIYREGAFVADSLSKKPDVIDKEAWKYIRYPAVAREHGIQGTVWITVVVDEFGRVEEFFLKKGIGSGCDEEAMKAMMRIQESGFEPAQYQGKPVKVKFDYPFKFLLP